MLYKFCIKIREKIENSALLKNLANEEIPWIRIPFIPVRIQDPDPHKNKILSNVALTEIFSKINRDNNLAKIGKQKWFFNKGGGVSSW